MRERLIKCKSLINGRVVDVPESQVKAFENKTLKVLAGQPKPRDMKHQITKGHGGVGTGETTFSGNHGLK